MRRLFQQVVLRQLLAERLRTAITVVGVAAGIAVVLAIRLTNASAVRGFEAALELTSGRAGLEIVGAGFGIDEQRLAELTWLSAYGMSSPVIDGDVLVGRDASPTRPTGGRPGGASLPVAPPAPYNPSSSRPRTELATSRSAITRSPRRPPRARPPTSSPC